MNDTNPQTVVQLNQPYEGRNMPENHRTLTDADVKALLDAAEERFQLNVGKGVTKIVWGIVLVAIIGVAYLGHLPGTK